jgi:primary-amine oxidase
MFGYPNEAGRRMLRVLSFYAKEKHARYGVFAHPIEGVVAHVDLLGNKVLKLVDTGYMDIPQTSGAYLDAEVHGPVRTDMQPLQIVQPQGPSFTVTDHVLKWQNWSVRLGFNGREGLTLHEISFADQGRERSIIHRASISEMVVPYGEPSPTHEWQNYFDAGESIMSMPPSWMISATPCKSKMRFVFMKRISACYGSIPIPGRGKAPCAGSAGW